MGREEVVLWRVKQHWEEERGMVRARERVEKRMMERRAIVSLSFGLVCG